MNKNLSIYEGKNQSTLHRGFWWTNVFEARRFKMVCITLVWKPADSLTNLVTFFRRVSPRLSMDAQKTMKKPEIGYIVTSDEFYVNSLCKQI